MLKNNYFKHVLTSMAGILIIGAIISYFLYLFLISYQKEEIYKKNLQFANYEIKENKSTIQKTIQRYKNTLSALVESIQEQNQNKDIKSLKKQMDILIKANHSIFQIRYINRTGQEIIRIDRNINNKIIEPKRLQNKSNRYYFQKTKNLNHNEFYISNLDLNIENKKIEKPFRPTIRVSTPIILKKRFEGIFIINFNAQVLIDKITKSKLFDIYYMDKEKRFLIHPNSHKSWSTQLSTNYKVEDEIKNIDSLIKKNTLDLENNYYVEKINLTDHNFFIILSIKKKFYNASIKETKKDILSLFFLVALIGFPFTLIIAYIQSRHVILLDYIVNSIPHPFFIKDNNGKFIIVNQEMLKLYNLKRKEQLIGKDSYNILNPISLNSKDKDELALEKGKLKTIEKFYIDTEKKYYFEMIRVKIPFYNIFKRTYLLCIAIDITEIQELNTQLNKKVEEEVNSRIKTEQILAQQSKMALMGEMIGNIAHQWRQPLSNITTASTGMKIQKEMHILKDDELINGLTQINNSAQYLSKTIDDFRNFFKPYKVKTNFTLEFIINKALKLVSAQFTNKSIQIVKEIEDTTILNLENEFTQVILNILNNARDELLKLESNEKFIFINSKKDKDSVIIQIKDNAGGISKEIEEKLYDAYFTTKDEDKGTGIGLYMSKQIIEKHMGGTLSHKNETFIYKDKEYKGAVFTIKLNLNEELENTKQ
ncbi:hypothetical protein CRU96_08755 [Malaciobacter halophilus]|nr:PAS domain-containing sensor histidine kinase [Malaciobacter halophilus]RYA23248.1 hypothetical protein CRU96_08755 [Malaciobacter halophilus]